MDDDIDWDLFAKYLSEEASAEEEEQIHAWAEESSRRAALLEELRQAWRLSDDSDSSAERSWKVERIWQRIREETTSDSAPKSSPLDQSREASSTDPSLDERTARTSRRRTASQQRSAWSFAGRVATLAILATAVALVAVWGTEPFIGGSSEAETFVTAEGQRAKVRLNDGSTVRLNVDSRLIVAEDFGDDRRSVRLEGGAFFDVAQDSTRPFLVHTAESTTRVLGTAFGVSAYREDEETSVVVREGKVALGSTDSSTGVESSRGDETSPVESPSIILSEGHHARLMHGRTKIVRDSGDVATHLAWLEGRLVFADAPFRQVTRTLERWYGLEIKLKNTDAAPPEGHLNAEFEEEKDLREVLKVVATAFGLEVKRPNSEKVIFHSASHSVGPQSASWHHSR